MAKPVAEPELRGLIRALNEQFMRNLKERNVEALVDGFYASDAQLLPPNAPAVAGQEDIRGFWRVVADQIENITLTSVKIDSSDELAYEIGRYTMRVGGAADRGKYVVIFRRQADGGWKAVADMFSSDGPAR